MRETKSTHISLIGTVGLWLAATIPTAAQTVRSGFAHEYVARGADVKTLEASRALKTTKDGRIIVGGDVTLMSSKPYQGPLPDRSGYYLCAWHRPGGDTKAAPAVSIVRLDNSGTIKWANTYSLGNSVLQTGPRVTEDGTILISLIRSDARSHKTLLAKVSPDGAVNWATTIDGVLGGPSDLHVHGDPYGFTKPYLLDLGTQSAVPGKLYSVLIAINYQTGKIEKQLKFGSNTPGSLMFIQKSANFFYAGFLNLSFSRPAVYHAALLKFDCDFNLLSARRIREPGSRFPGFHLLSPGSGLVWYSYESKPTVFLESTNENLESPDPCKWLDKDTFTKSTVEQHPLEVVTTPLTSITVSDVKGGNQRS